MPHGSPFIWTSCMLSCVEADSSTRQWRLYFNLIQIKCHINRTFDSEYMKCNMLNSRTSPKHTKNIGFVDSLMICPFVLTDCTWNYGLFHDSFSQPRTVTLTHNQPRLFELSDSSWRAILSIHTEAFIIARLDGLHQGVDGEIDTTWKCIFYGHHL